MNSRKIWLVEIRAKDWVFLPQNQSRVIGYEEVIANNKVDACHSGFDQFVNKMKYSPIIKRKLQAMGIGEKDFCAPDAVELDD